MKKYFFTQKITAVIIIAVFLITNSCSKHEDPTGSTAQIDQQGKQIIALIKKIPEMKITNNKLSYKPTKGGFDFSQPTDGFNYSSSDGVSYSKESHTLYISPNSLGSGTGGTVVAGDCSLDINYTFCFSADQDGLGFNFFNQKITGVSSVIGISGDFNLLNSKDTANIDYEKAFKGFAVYVIYSKEASGTYKILDWIKDLSKSESELKDKAFAYIIDFQNQKIFFSMSGNLTAKGGTIGFEGKYFEISNFVLDGTLDEDHLKYKEVSGFGAMGCK